MTDHEHERETTASLAQWRHDAPQNYQFCARAVEWHLYGNLYPPLPEWQPAALAALAAFRAGADERLVKVPVPAPEGQTAYMTANDVLERLRLSDWAEADAFSILVDDTDTGTETAT